MLRWEKTTGPARGLGQGLPGRLNHRLYEHSSGQRWGITLLIDRVTSTKFKVRNFCQCVPDDTQYYLNMIPVGRQCLVINLIPTPEHLKCSCCMGTAAYPLFCFNMRRLRRRPRKSSCNLSQLKLELRFQRCFNSEAKALFHYATENHRDSLQQRTYVMGVQTFIAVQCYCCGLFQVCMRVFCGSLQVAVPDMLT